MVTQDGLKKCLETYNGLRESVEAEKNDESEVKAVETKLSKSAKRRQRKKRLTMKENGTSPDEFEPKKGEQKETNRVSPCTSWLVTHADKRPGEDFLCRSLMAAFLLKCLQRVGFFENPSRTNG